MLYCGKAINKARSHLHLPYVMKNGYTYIWNLKEFMNQINNLKQLWKLVHRSPLGNYPQSEIVPLLPLFSHGILCTHLYYIQIIYLCICPSPSNVRYLSLGVISYSYFHFLLPDTWETHNCLVARLIKCTIMQLIILRVKRYLLVVYLDVHLTGEESGA